jgi:hypothetical protein
MIQNTETSQARSLFRVIAVFILFYPWRAAGAGAAAADLFVLCYLLNSPREKTRIFAGFRFSHPEYMYVSSITEQ